MSIDMNIRVGQFWTFFRILCKNMLFAPPTSCVGQTQSQAAAESGYCLLNIAVESSTSRAGSSVVEESEVTSVKTSYSPGLNQQSRLTVFVNRAEYSNPYIII